MSSVELKETIQNLGVAFTEFKAANDARLEKLEDGQSTNELESKLANVSAALDDLRDQKERLEALETKNNRIGGGQGAEGGSEQDIAYKNAFDGYFRKGRDRLDELQQKALSIGVDASGGYSVHAEIDTEIDRVSADFSPMRGLANVMKINSSEYKRYISLGGAASGWVGETDARPETATPTLAELVFNAKEVYAEPRTTQWLLDDSIINIAQWLSDEVGIEFAEQEGDKFIRGDGVKQPEGLLTATTVDNDSWSWGNIGTINSGAAGAFVAAPNASDALIDVQHALKRGFRANATWLLNDLTLASVRKLKDSDGNLLWRPGIEVGQPETLLGKPVETDDFMPDMAADSLSIAFADFKRAYLIVDRIGVRVQRDDVTLKGYIKFYTTKRVGGGINNYEAAKFLKFAA